jgi:asparagine synthase (glutamine-hydrolysing)
MCGIAGTAGGAAPEPRLLDAMAATMASRGPDGHGTWHDDTTGFAFRRLAIIDLDPRSDQPMHLGRLHLVFNGELYNYPELRDELRARGHEFHTEGDGEVLLTAWAEWGEAALDRVNGMFAFAIWDDGAQRLTLARDPFGEKPLYYARTRDGRLVFGSEIKALLHDPGVDGRENPRALAAFVAHTVMPAPPDSFFAGIQRLPAAHVLRWQAGRVEVARYWRPGPIAVPARYGDAAAELRQLLLDSIRLRLRSDVPVGTSLSGGIDSSSVVMLSAELAGDHRRHAFTARFPGYERDEWHHAESVARAAQVEHHHPVEPTAAEALADLDRLVLDHEEPVATLSIYAQWRVNQAAADEGVVVLLDGQGGDELFAGYPVAAGFAVRSGGPAAALRELAARPVPTAAAVGTSLAMDHLRGRLRAAYRRRSASPYAAATVASDPTLGEQPAAEPWMRAMTPLGRELGVESFLTSLPTLLRYADRSSMAHSREVRLPFLDRRVAEFAFSLPAPFLYRHGRSKAILRDAMQQLVPAEILARRDKVGFEPPQGRWLHERAFRDRIADVLLDRDARSRGLYDNAAIERDTKAGRWRDPWAIWRAVNAELWLRTFVAARPAASQLAGTSPSST